MLAALMLHPYVVLLVEDPSVDPVTTAGHICLVLADLVLLVSALVLSFDARLRRSLVRARMATAATLVAVQDLPLLVISVADPTQGGHGHRLTAGHLATVVVVLLVLTVRTRDQLPPRLSPLLGGLLLGCAVLGVRLSILVLDPTPFLSVRTRVDLALLVAITAVTMMIAVAILRSPLPGWAAARVACGVAALFASRVLSTAVETSSPPPLAMIGVVVFSALVATTVIGLLIGTLRDTAARESTLLVRAAEAEATVRHDREVAHEVRSATAGIVAGVHLLASGQVPPGPRQVALRHMVDAEAARLGRTGTEDHPDELTSVDVDGVVEPLVVAEGALGHPVLWQPSGHRVAARPDELAEVLHILLTNALRHGGGQGTAVVSRASDAGVEIRVSDHGPGIEPDVRGRLFQWGVRGSSSSGQGIGLQRAHRLVLELGGSLRLDEAAAHRDGATFVVVLPDGADAAGADAGAPVASGGSCSSAAAVGWRG